MHPASFPWDHFRYAEALIYYARAVGAARSGNTVSARKDVEKLSAIQSALTEPRGSYWANQVEVERRTAKAWLALAEGNKAEALTLMRSAADLEATTEKHPVTPGPVIPARELLGDMLIELNQPEQALREFEGSLGDSPNRLVHGNWIAEFLDEACSFPHGKHDDMIDSLSGGIQMITKPKRQILWAVTGDDEVYSSGGKTWKENSII